MSNMDFTLRPSTHTWKPTSAEGAFLATELCGTYIVSVQLQQEGWRLPARLPIRARANK